MNKKILKGMVLPLMATALLPSCKGGDKQAQMMQMQQQAPSLAVLTIGEERPKRD